MQGIGWTQEAAGSNCERPGTERISRSVKPTRNGCAVCVVHQSLIPECSQKRLARVESLIPPCLAIEFFQKQRGQDILLGIRQGFKMLDNLMHECRHAQEYTIRDSPA